MNVPARSAAMLMIIVAAACGAGRLFSAQKLNEPSLSRDPMAGEEDRRPDWSKSRPRPMPTFSSNDRSRWATVRSLVEKGTYVVGVREPSDEKPFYKDSGLIFEDGWQSIDKVLHPEKKEFYASKPPLLSTLVAGLYWLLHTIFGWTLDGQPFTVVRTILFLVNIVPFFVYLLVIDHWAGRLARSGWTQLVVVTAAGFATTVTPFLITFNNHTLGTFSVLFAIDAVLAITTLKATSPLRYFQAGLFAAFAVTNELPALSLAACVFAILARHDLKRTLAFALPPALLIAGAFFAMNLLAVGQLRPAYSEFGSSWYEYEGSYWRKPPAGEMRYGIDWAAMHESKATYAMHVLVGHHGLFLLTPLWLLAIAGMFVIAKPNRESPQTPIVPESGEVDLPRWFGPMAATITVVVVGFYLYKSDNYGGWTNGLRWLMWISPIWLLTMIPVIDVMSRSKGSRAVVYVFLAISVVSASYSPWNPWRHPWPYDLFLACGWPGYGR